MLAVLLCTGIAIVLGGLYTHRSATAPLTVADRCARQAMASIERSDVARGRSAEVELLK